MGTKVNPVIVTENLTRHFGDVVAVDHLTLEVYAGEVFGFLGHNGAGKTTTVRLLNGVLAPNDGTARVLNIDPMTDGPALRARTGVLTETPSLDERLTARENLQIYAELYDVPHAEVSCRVEKLLETFELADRADEKAGGYSRGMKQRLALARTLLHRPELLFLDEPTHGLDPVAAHHVREMIARLSHEKCTIFLCTHNLAEAQSLCSRVAVLEHGRLVALGTPAELMRQLGPALHLQIEVAPDGLSAALDVLKAIPNIVASPAQESSIVTVTGGDREMIPDLVASLVSAGTRIYQVASREPSLEDVYFALHGERKETL